MHELGARFLNESKVPTATCAQWSAQVVIRTRQRLAD